MSRSRVGLPALVLAVAACSTSPESFLVQTPNPMPDAYSCVVRTLNTIGFTIEGADKDAGFVRASRQTSGLGRALLTGKKYHDQLTFSIFDAGNGKNTIRATAARAEQNVVLGNFTKSEGNKPSDSGRSAAREVLNKCGTGDVVKQSSTTFETTGYYAVGG